MQNSHRLDILVLGAGLGGLSAALCLARYGHRVCLYEASVELSELGAGIQIPPNAMRILDAWDLASELQQYASKPDVENLRRYSNGKLLGHQKRNMKQMYGHDSLVIHRADFQRLLYRAAIEHHVDFSFGKRLKPDELLGLTASEGVGPGRFDLIVAADGWVIESRINPPQTNEMLGISSPTRASIASNTNSKPRLTGDTASRIILPSTKLLSDPQLSHLIEQPTNNVWFGPGRHVVAYPIRNLELYNVVLCGPGDAPIGVYNEPYDLGLLRSEFSMFEPTVQAIFDKADSAHRWTISEVPPLEHWSSSDGRTVLLGDAAHAMMPYGAQGAAQCIEDAAVLGVCLSRARSDSDLPELLKQYEALRKPRCERIQTVVKGNQAMFGYEDGPQQEVRDARFAKTLESFGFAEPTMQSSTRPVPDPMAPYGSPEFNEWLYNHDAIRDAEEYLARVWDSEHLH